MSWKKEIEINCFEIEKIEINLLEGLQEITLSRGLWRRTSPAIGSFHTQRFYFLWGYCFHCQVVLKNKLEHYIMMIFFLWDFLLEYSFVIYLNWNRFKSLKGDTHFSKFHILYLVCDAFQFSELGSHPWLSVLFRRQYIFSSLSFCCKHFSSLKSLVQPKYIVISHHWIFLEIYPLLVSMNFTYFMNFHLLPNLIYYLL